MGGRPRLPLPALAVTAPLALLKGNVIGWRKQFAATGKNGAPRDGGHWAILAAGKKPSAGRRPDLDAGHEPGGRESYEEMLRQAAVRLHDRPQTRKGGG